MNDTQERELLDLKRLGRVLRGYRNMAGLTGEELERLLVRELNVSVSSRSIYEYERGGRTPTIETFIALSIALSIPPAMVSECILDEGQRSRYDRLRTRS